MAGPRVFAEPFRWADAGRGAPGGRERGFALLLVLWTMVLLSLIGTRIAASGCAQAQLAANVRDAAVTEAAADGAIQEAAFHLLDAPPRRWAADGAKHVLAMPGGVAVEVRIESEEGQVNPNLASAELLVALMREVGADRRTAGTVSDGILLWGHAGSTESTLLFAARLRLCGALITEIWETHVGGRGSDPRGRRRSG